MSSLYSRLSEDLNGKYHTVLWKTKSYSRLFLANSAVTSRIYSSLRSRLNDPSRVRRNIVYSSTSTWSTTSSRPHISSIQSRTTCHYKIKISDTVSCNDVCCVQKKSYFQIRVYVKKGMCQKIIKELWNF